jgi:hypothetical protein
VGDWKRHKALTKQLRTCKNYVAYEEASAILYGSYLTEVTHFIDQVARNPREFKKRVRLLPWMVMGAEGQTVFDYMSDLNTYIHQLGTYAVLLQECEPGFTVSTITSLEVFDEDGDWYILCIPTNKVLKRIGKTLKQRLEEIARERMVKLAQMGSE